MSDVTSTPPTLAAPAPEVERIRLRQAAEAFEGLFLQTLLKTMREAQLKDGFFGDGPGASTYEGIFEQQMAERLSQGSPLGIATMLEAEWGKRLDGARAAEDALKAIDSERGRRLYDSATDTGAKPTPASPPPSRPKAETAPGVAAPGHATGQGNAVEAGGVVGNVGTAGGPAGSQPQNLANPPDSGGSGGREGERHEASGSQVPTG